MQFLFPIDHSPFHFVHLFLQIPDIAAYTKNVVNIERADQTWAQSVFLISGFSDK